MAKEIITIDDLENFRVKLLEDIRQIIKQTTPNSKEWLRSSEVRKLLGISPGTLQNLRVNRVLAYTRVGGMIYYRYTDILKVLEKGNG